MTPVDRSSRALHIDAPIILANGHIDRATEHRRDEAWLAERWAAQGARVVVVDDGVLPVDPGGAALRWVRPADLPADVAAPRERLLLGVEGDTSYFAVRARIADVLGADTPAAGLRTIAPGVDPTQAGLAVHAVALANWHAAHPRCPRCGAPTVLAEGGHLRRCPADGSEHYPRTDPAMIVLVTDADDRALLGHNAAALPGRYSTLAGFVEPGESLEQAVVREVHEEVGIEVTDVAYAGSQPWPFPSSLMVGFFARAESHEIRVDGVEITDARWFSRDEVAAGLAAGTLGLPTGMSIARRLVAAWFPDWPVD